MKPRLHGLMAELLKPAHLVEAARRVHAAGYRKVDAYTPFPIEELSEALELPRSPLSKLVLAGGIVGGGAGYGLAYWTSVISYPLNIGGRPLHSWPAFIVPTFETTILFAAASAVLGMILLNRLPEPYHPVFNVPAFAAASRSHFFICIENADPKFDPAATRSFLESLPDVVSVSEVEK